MLIVAAAAAAVAAVAAVGDGAKDFGYSIVSRHLKKISVEIAEIYKSLHAYYSI